MFSLSTSSLYNESTFYNQFCRDLNRARQCVVIESPFITTRRMMMLFPILIYLRRRGVRVVINTKPFSEHASNYREQTMDVVSTLQDIGVEVLCTIGHHRKLAIIDSNILYEGSLNILSQNNSREVMRRIRGKQYVSQMLAFTNLMEWYK